MVTRVKHWVKLLRTKEIQAFLYWHNMNKVIKKTLNNSPSVFCGKTSWVLNFNHWNISWNLLVSVALGYLCYLSGCRIGLWVKKDKKQKSTEVRVKKKKADCWCKKLKNCATGMAWKLSVMDKGSWLEQSLFCHCVCQLLLSFIKRLGIEITYKWKGTKVFQGQLSRSFPQIVVWLSLLRCYRTPLCFYWWPTFPDFRVFK